MKVLFIVNHPEEGASSRNRVYQYLPYLRENGVYCAVRPFTSRKLYSVMHDKGRYGLKVALTLRSTWRRILDLCRAGKFDVLFIHREAFPFGPPWMEMAFQGVNARIIYDFDDAVYIGHRDVSTMTDPLLYRLKYGDRFAKIIKMSRHVIAGNRFLEAYARKFNPSVSVIPTVADLNRYKPDGPIREPDPLVLGWLGSPSTEMHLEMLRPVFAELFKKYGRKILLKVVGAKKFWMDSKYFTAKPWNLEDEIVDLRSFHIGLMPLKDDEWTRSKCAFKAIQYMSVGISVVCSPVGIVQDFITNGENGFIARSTQEWLEKLSLLIENGDLCTRLGKAGRKTVERYYSLQLWAPRFLAVLRDVYSPKCISCA